MKYINSDSTIEPETTVVLLEEEQTHLMHRMPEFLDILRYPEDPGKRNLLNSRHRAFSTVNGNIQEVITGLLNQEKSLSCSEFIVNIQNRQHLLGSLEQVLYDFSSLLMSFSHNQSMAECRSIFIEGLDTILLTVSDSFQTNDPSDLDMVLLMTSDKSELMRNLRKMFLTQKDLPGDSQAAILELTTLFERTVWILGKITLLQQQCLKQI